MLKLFSFHTTPHHCRARADEKNDESEPWLFAKLRACGSLATVPPRPASIFSHFSFQLSFLLPSSPSLRAAAPASSSLPTLLETPFLLALVWKSNPCSALNEPPQSPGHYPLAHHCSSTHPSRRSAPLPAPAPAAQGTPTPWHGRAGKARQSKVARGRHALALQLV